LKKKNKDYFSNYEEFNKFMNWFCEAQYFQ